MLALPRGQRPVTTSEADQFGQCRNGVNVQGYIHWSLADNWEWGSGFKPRFGLYYTDYEDNLKRHAKKSAEWYKAFLQGGH